MAALDLHPLEQIVNVQWDEGLAVEFRESDPEEETA